MGLAEAFGMSLENVVSDYIKPMMKGRPGQMVVSDEERRKKIRKRLDLYNDRADEHLKDAVDAVWNDPEVKAERKALVPYSRFQNVTRKVSHTVASVYSEPARRTAARKKDTAAIERIIEDARVDEELREADRLMVFTNDIFLAIRTRNGAPVVESVTQDNFSVISNPRDPREMAAIVLDMHPSGPAAGEEMPHYLVWDDAVKFHLNAKLEIVGVPVEHDLGFIPGVLVHRQKPRTSLLDADSGQDIADAHIAVGLMNIMMLHGQKAGTKAPYVSGDLSNTARGQSMDHDKVIQFEEGVTPGVLDLGHDPNALIQSARSVIAQVAANYSISQETYEENEKVTSGFDRKLKRTGLDELRRERVMVFRAVERELFAKLSVLLGRDGQEHYHFSPEGFRVDFGEVKTPMSPLEDLNWRKEARSLLLTTVLDDLKELNPDLRDKDLAPELARIIRARATEIELHRALNMPKDPTDPGNSPQENGAMGGPKGEQQQQATEADNSGSEAA